jgi:hypothetical protein
MNTLIDDFGISNTDKAHFISERAMGRIETSSAPCYCSPDSPILFHRFTDWETVGKMSEQPLSPRRRHRKAKLSLAHVLTMKFQPEAVFQFDVWSYFTLSHSEQASGQYQMDDTRDDPHQWTDNDTCEVFMTGSQLADLLARTNLEEDERLDPSLVSEGSEHPTPMKQLGVEEMTDILRHINLCEQTKSAIQYDVINRMVYPDMEVEPWQPLGSIALNSESCVSSVSWEESISDSSSIDDESQDDSLRSTRSVDSEFQDI